MQDLSWRGDYIPAHSHATWNVRFSARFLSIRFLLKNPSQIHVLLERDIPHVLQLEASQLHLLRSQPVHRPELGAELNRVRRPRQSRHRCRRLYFDRNNAFETKSDRQGHQWCSTQCREG
jgi:hypothetical protein